MVERILGKDEVSSSNLLSSSSLTPAMPFRTAGVLHRGIAQLVEQRSPKPRAEGSNPSTPAKDRQCKADGLFVFAGGK